LPRKSGFNAAPMLSGVAVVGILGDVSDRHLPRGTREVWQADSCLSGCFSKPQYVGSALAWLIGDLRLVRIIGGGFVPRPETEQGLEHSHRLRPPVMAKDEFIQISLESMAPDSMMRSEQLLLQVADGAAGQRHCGLRTSM
jgi:hypothetical protein